MLVIRKQALTETFSDYFTHPSPTNLYLLKHENTYEVIKVDDLRALHSTLL